VKEVDAALAYDQAAREYHKAKAQLNFPDWPPQPQGASSEAPTKRARGEQVRLKEVPAGSALFTSMPPACSRLMLDL
jgi:hypothetical protein